MKLNGVLIYVLMFGLVFTGLYTAQTSIATPPVLSSVYTTSPPTIDGSLGVGEWSNGINITLNGYTTPGNTVAGTLYIMNNGTHLFIALVIYDSTYDVHIFSGNLDWVMINFDQGHDHTATFGGEDAVDFSYYATGYSDNFWGTDPWGYTWWTTDVGDGGTSHGQGEVNYFGGNGYVYEMSKPLNSTEAKDIALALGDVVGFRIEVWEQTASDNYRYPQNTVDANTSRWNEWLT